MNREEFKKLVEEEFINNTMKHLDSALIFTYIQNLEQKINNLQSKIDKANEILNRPQFEYDNIPCNCEEDIKELKEVLKEAENV